jgi:uncharacterized membrane protein YbhN (UPF0104 family)
VLSRTLVGHAEFAWSAFGASALLACIALGVSGSFARGRVAERALGLLRRLPIARLQHALNARCSSFTATDSLAGRYFAAGIWRTTLLPGVCFFGGWLCESLESYLILKLLGVELGFFAIASCEVLLSFLKNVLFVVPSGIGVQDVGYVACLTALGVPDALHAGAAFSVLKRGKELLWATLGYTLLASEARPQTVSVARFGVDVA